MSRRTRRPEETRLELSGGDWILVKESLTAGETRRMYAAMIKAGTLGDVDPLEVGVAKILAYLIDWSFLDAGDRPMVIRAQAVDVVTAQLDALDPDTFAELVAAIDAHIEARKAVHDQEKKDPDGASASSPISRSAA